MKKAELRATCLCLVSVFTGGSARAQTPVERVVYTFGNFPRGANPYGTPALDASGNLYGTTFEGGGANLGVVFEWSSSSYTVLHNFAGGSDGANPDAGVTLDSAGNIYGTTYYGGTANAGVVYEIPAGGKETVLYSFTGGADGANPYAGVILDSAGNLYGTTYQGGTSNSGVVYKLTPAGQEAVLYAFTGGADGGNPYGGVVSDPEGNLYGTTYAGGNQYNHAGVVYRLNPAGQEKVLYTFPGDIQGANPYAGVVRDSEGNLYGTADGVGGIIYKIGPSGTYKTLHQLKGSGPGGLKSGLALDAAGNLYGTTQSGGANNMGVAYKMDTVTGFQVLYSFPGAPADVDYKVSTGSTGGVALDAAGNVYGTTPYGGAAGIVFEAPVTGAPKVLYTMRGAPGGSIPFGNVIQDSEGNLYGTTQHGGAMSAGVVWKVSPAGEETTLYSFKGEADGQFPRSTLARDAEGNLYGTCFSGGAYNLGVVFRLSPSRQLTVLHSFTGGADGASPTNGVALDSAGNVYGTTAAGGTGSQTGAQEGVVFKLAAVGDLTVLHSFTGLADGGDPDSDLLLDASGNLYGTTNGGGLGVGVLYMATVTGEYTVLHSFTGGADGGIPFGRVAIDGQGNIYGTAADWGQLPDGGQGEGVVFEIDTTGTLTVLYTFTGGADGAGPVGDVALDSAGNLYGVTNAAGDECSCGTVYEIASAGQFILLHDFTGGGDGGLPFGGVILAPSGEVYGMTQWQGTAGAGVLFRVTP
jgi:uncharacterized repeat protein (TIGR03803 family)